ncbi:MAG: LOG family protein [Phycisphaerae bacterium]|nr:LOG family protein [Phycisphaerae bacterium]MCZ2399454.1 LOG family protein [Phycisphaerae bacterium]NUQ49195.1 LOG family protein [Phycisphaerae bacterium]
MADSRLRARNEGPRTARDIAVEQFAAAHLSGENQDLYADMLVTLCRLARDGAARGDVKLLHKSLAELRYGLKVFAPYADIRKVSIFGSSRTHEDHPDYRAAEDFARRMCATGWMVITGAGGGIMRAGHGGAGAEASFGVAIRLPFEQKTNEIIADDPKLVNYRYFFTRKVTFLRQSSAVALFPGGFGTQDEGFEALTLVQTGKAPLIPIVMCERPGGTYWPHWRTYIERELLANGMISPEDMHLFRITDDVQEAVRDIQDFYRVYHSMRYVGEELVLRLSRAVSAETVERLNDEFAGRILSAGRITASPALPAENGELPDLPRLRLCFDRKSYGLLRCLVDRVNQEP